MTKSILYKLNWSGGDHWYFRLGISTPDGLSQLFEDGTLFRAGHPASYAAYTPEEALSAAEVRVQQTISDEVRRLKHIEEELATSRKLLTALHAQSLDLAAEAKLLTKCRERVEQFFKGDLDKTRLWFKTQNPLLGDLAPDDFIVMHKTERLLSFIEAQLAQNEPAV
jgi:hypothetical protein